MGSVSATLCTTPASAPAGSCPAHGRTLSRDERTSAGLTAQPRPAAQAKTCLQRPVLLSVSRPPRRTSRSRIRPSEGQRWRERLRPRGTCSDSALSSARPCGSCQDLPLRMISASCLEVTALGAAHLGFNSRRFQNVSTSCFVLRQAARLAQVRHGRTWDRTRDLPRVKRALSR